MTVKLGRSRALLTAAACAACLMIGFVTPTAYGYLSAIVWGKKIQTLESGDARHSATLLKKHHLGDINFIVEVDGRLVYTSPDLMPFVDGAYRETLLWDETGRVVVLELMGKRVFAYDSQDRRRLGKGELSRYKLFPLPSDQNYAEIRDLDE